MTLSDELISQRKNTMEFIGAKPVVIHLKRKIVGTNDREGVEVLGEESVPPQLFRHVKYDPQMGRRGNEARSNSGAKVEVTKDALLGKWSANIRDEDEFQLHGHWYRVHYVDDERSYRTLATVVLRDSD